MSYRISASKVSSQALRSIPRRDDKARFSELRTFWIFSLQPEITHFVLQKTAHAVVVTLEQIESVLWFILSKAEFEPPIPIQSKNGSNGNRTAVVAW